MDIGMVTEFRIRGKTSDKQTGERREEANKRGRREAIKSKAPVSQIVNERV